MEITKYLTLYREISGKSIKEENKLFLHLGENVVVPIKDVIGIFDINSSMYGSDTAQFLRLAEEDGFVERITKEQPKSFVIAEVNKKSKIYLSPISSSTLTKRSDINYDL